MICTHKNAMRWLVDHGACPRLVLHGQIVSEVAQQLSDALAALGTKHDAMLTVAGAVLHDLGKTLHPEELDGPGIQHELAGKHLLLQNGSPAGLAEMCVRHAVWAADSTLEQLIVATADHIWRGKRTADLESLLIAKIADILGVQPWEAFLKVDPMLSAIAAGADTRLIAARGG